MKALTSSYLKKVWMISLIPLLIHTTPRKVSTPAQNNTHKYLQIITAKIKELPTQYQPTDLKRALVYILEGQQVWKYIQSQQWYEALNITSLNTADTNIIKQAFNTNPDELWHIIHKDLKVKEIIEKYSIKFTRQSLLNQQYAMLFRCGYLRSNITQEKILEKIQGHFMQAIIALQWYIFAQAILEDGICTSCMITVKDPHHKLFNFLDGYAEFVSPHYRLYSAAHPHSLWQAHAYTRKTREWKHKKLFGDMSFGINLYTADKKATPVLPGQKSHIMFGALNNGYTFVTWKTTGLRAKIKTKDLSDLKAPIKYFKKDSHKKLNIDRLEKTPQDIVHHFRSLLTKELETKHEAWVKHDGIAGMLKALDAENKKLFTEFLTQRKKYLPQTLPVRKGNEIILLPSRFKVITNHS